MDLTDTGFTDKTGQAIQIGDIVQVRAPGSTVGKSLFVVGVANDQAALFVPGTIASPGAPGVRLTQDIADLILVVDRPE